MSARMQKIAATTALALVLANGAAQAQSIEYGAMESMFGEPVTMSATGKPQRVSEAPVNMTILTADDIRRSGADNIPDALRFVAGIDVRSYGAADAAVSIRGNNTALNPRVLVLLDGRQVYQDDYGLTVWPLIPVALQDIRQIEIIRGPNAALYGFNAVSGVINIVTYDPLHDNINALRFDAGSMDEVRGEATTTYQVPGKLGIRLSATGFSSREYSGNEAYSTGERPHNGNVGLDMRVQLAPGVEWDISGSFGSLEDQTFVDLGAYAPTAYRANSIRSKLAAETGIGLLGFDIYRNENRVTAHNPLDTDHWREDVTSVQVSDLVKIGSQHTIRLAGEYRDNSVSSLESFHGRVGYHVASASLMDDWQITQRLAWTNAIRVDSLFLEHSGAQFAIPTVTPALYQNHTIIEPSFNSGLVYKVTDFDTVRLTAARAIQLPSLLDFGYTKDAGYAIVSGNPGLQPSAVLNYELDYDRSLPMLASSLRLAGFVERTDNTIGSPFGSGVTFLPTGQLLLLAQNFGYSTDIGGELGLKGSSNGWRWDISYALASVTDHTPGGVPATAPSAALASQTPTSSIIAGLGYTIGKWEIDGKMRWQSRFEDYRVDLATLSYQTVSVPNYVTLTTRVGYNITNGLTVALTADQLNDRRIVESAGLQTERRFIVNCTAKF